MVNESKKRDPRSRFKWLASGAIKQPVPTPWIFGIIKPRRIVFPLFEIASNPTIPLTQIKERRFDLITRWQGDSQEDLDEMRVRNILQEIVKTLEE